MKVLLFSDGTGNSSAKLFRTNVWRLYDALDLTPVTDQVAFYDNGVGTASFKPLAILGGAFGWGLKRNVLDIYSFLCRTHAQPGTHQIYAFGFSRGAFTIRVLLGLLRTQGVVPYNGNEQELNRCVAWAYRRYRGTINPTGGLVRPLRKLRDWLLTRLEKLRSVRPYNAAANKKIDVEFVGLWDTVAAYGSPIDELTRAWDLWIWPLSLPTRMLFDRVKKACHALALDDERQTFHPLLWDETNEVSTHHSRTIVAERVSQVWFSGMHSNVGGGYPDDGMAYESLSWMATQATDAQLLPPNVPPIVLKPGVLADWQRRCSLSAPIADSRKGLAAYYRYLPRLVEAIADNAEAHVGVPRIKIHESVFARIQSGVQGYAPIVLPSRYAVVYKTGAIEDIPDHGVPRPPAIEDAGQAADRRRKQEAAWDLVWLRRITYFLNLAAAGLFLALPLMQPLFPWSLPAVSGAISVVALLVPSALAWWVEYFEAYPAQLVVFGGLVLSLTAVSARLQVKIDDCMRHVWHGGDHRGIPFVRRIRTSGRYRSLATELRSTIVPNALGFVLLMTFLIGVVAIILRLILNVPMLVGQACTSLGDDRAHVVGAQPSEFIDFDPKNLCQATGFVLQRGVSYKLRISPPDPHWHDGSRPVLGLRGFSSDSLLCFVTLPIRRHLGLNWFVLIARIGSSGDEYVPLTEPVTVVEPSATGQLFLYLNDALWVRKENPFYENNSGDPVTIQVKTFDKNDLPW